MFTKEDAPAGSCDTSGRRRVRSGRTKFQRRNKLIGLRRKACEGEERPILAEARVEPPKAAPKRLVGNDDLIIMLAGLGFLIAGTGLGPYLVALFSRE